MTKEEKNEAIAKILGFKQYGITVNGVKNAEMAWAYPDKYRYLSHASPEYNCPNFIQIIEDMRKINTIIQGWE